MGEEGGVKEIIWWGEGKERYVGGIKNTFVRD